MSLWNHYFVVDSVQAALKTLEAAPGPARLIAGGTDLLLDLQQGRLSPMDTLVDVTRIPELTVLEMRDMRIYIGAAVPLNRIVASPLIQVHAQALVEACGQIGGPQVRNTGTLGGNVCHALPAADGTIALIAMGAEAEIAHIGGRRRVSLEELFLGPGKSTLAEGRELLVGFFLPPNEPGQASAFLRVMRPQGVALPILNMAAWIQRQGERIAGVRLALGPAGKKPLRAYAAERVLSGGLMNERLIAEAEEAMLSEAQFRSSRLRASAAYRRYLSGFLLRETLTRAWERAWVQAGEVGLV